MAPPMPPALLPATYARLGSYRVRLQATGPGGTDTTSRIVQVNRLDALNIGRLAGNYYGRWTDYRSGASLPGGGPVTSSGYTNMQVAVLNATMVQVSSFSVVTYSPSASLWGGNAPQRNHLDFSIRTSGWPASTEQLLQVEQTGDSIFFNINSYQNALFSAYRFYGKKQP